MPLNGISKLIRDLLFVLAGADPGFVERAFRCVKDGVGGGGGGGSLC